MNRPNLNTKPEQKMHPNNDKSVSSLFRLHALNVMLPVFAAVRRRACNMAPAAIDRSISLARRMLSRNSPAAIAAVDRWDRRTDARPLDPAAHTTRAASVRAYSKEFFGVHNFKSSCVV